MTSHRLLELYRQETRVSPAQLRAVERGLEYWAVPLSGEVPSSARVRPRLRPWFTGTALAAIGAAALLLAWPRPEPHLDLVLAAPQAQSLALGDDVRITYEGNGEVTGTPRDTEITWTVGTLSVEVEPGTGLQLVVHTREAAVRVVGTAFELTRDALGTHVEVERGKVEVTCLGVAPQILSPGEDCTCDPVSPAAQLGRARRLRAEGASADQVLAAADIGLAAAEPGTAEHGELQLVRVLALVDLGRTEEALIGAEAYLEEEPSGAREQVEVLAEQLRRELESEGE